MKLPILRLRHFGGLLAAGLSLWLLPFQAIAAEKVVLNYKIFQETVSVEDLATLAETGQPSPALSRYLRLAGKTPEEVQQPLAQEVKISPVLLDRVLNSWLGEGLLDQLGQVFRTPSGQANRQALRSALVLSASGDSTITLIEVIQNYPTTELYVDGDRLVDAYNQLNSLEQKLQNLLNIF